MLATSFRRNTNFDVLERNELTSILSKQSLGILGLTKEVKDVLNRLYKGGN